MLKTLAIANCRSLLDLTIPLGRLNVITGASASGKSNLYKALRLLSDRFLAIFIPISVIFSTNRAYCYEKNASSETKISQKSITVPKCQQNLVRR